MIRDDNRIFYKNWVPDWSQSPYITPDTPSGTVWPRSGTLTSYAKEADKSSKLKGVSKNGEFCLSLKPNSDFINHKINWKTQHLVALDITDQ